MQEQRGWSEISEIAELWTIAQRAISRETREKLATIVNSRVHNRYEKARARSFLSAHFLFGLPKITRPHAHASEMPRLRNFLVPLSNEKHGFVSWSFVENFHLRQIKFKSTICYWKKKERKKSPEELCRVMRYKLRNKDIEFDTEIFLFEMEFVFVLQET